MTYFRKKKPQWIVGVSDYDGKVPTPPEPVLVKEMLMDGTYSDRELKPNLFCPITTSMGIMSGNLLLDGHSRAMLATIGYVFPTFTTEMIYM